MRQEGNMDIKLNYIEKGEGKPLIMIHGNEESSDYFKAQFDYFNYQIEK